jgi:tricarballylate dehydrogenase
MRELNCDVVVVGCGAAGLTAALAALQNGAKVILLERSTVDDRGGNTRWTEALLRMTPDGEPTRNFIQRFTDQAGYHITPEFVQATAANYESWPALVKALPFTDPELLSTFVDGIPGVLEWLRRHGISIHTSIYPLPPAVRGDPWPGIQGGGLAIIEALFPAIEKLGARIEYETTAVRLLTDDDERVVGIKRPIETMRAS